MKKTTEKIYSKQDALDYFTILLNKAITEKKSDETVKIIRSAIDEISNDNIIVHLSLDNSKMGEIPSNSTAACFTCNPSAACYKICYGKRGERFTAVKINNLLNTFNFYLNPDKYFTDFYNQLRYLNTRFFRFNVSGDLINDLYFSKVVELCNKLPDITFLQYTKKYEIVNRFIDNGGSIPDNLIMQFSTDPNLPMDNKYNFRVVKIFSDPAEITEKKNVFICPYKRSKKAWSCSGCAALGIGCYSKTVKTLYLKKH